MSEEKPLSMTPDMELAKQLRKDFTAKTCVEALMRSVAEISAAIGVTVSWEVVSIEDKATDREALSKAIGRLATAGGALLTGGKINPISTLDAQDPIRILRENRSVQK